MPKATRTMYAQATTTGNPSAHETDEGRFGRKVTVMPNGCWAWRGDLTRYGKFKRQVTGYGSKDAENIPAHRFAYETLVGRIPEGHHLHHECENPGCVNPAHLVPLTPADHAARHVEMRASGSG